MPRDDLATLVTHLLQSNPDWYQHDGVLPIPASSENKFSQQLAEHVEKIRLCPAGEALSHSHFVSRKHLAPSFSFFSHVAESSALWLDFSFICTMIPRSQVRCA